MSDIRHALLRRDPLSAAKEVLYHLDIALGSSIQNAQGLDKNTVDLVEEFIFNVSKDRNGQRKVRRKSQLPWLQIGRKCVQYLKVPQKYRFLALAILYVLLIMLYYWEEVCML